MNINLPSAGGKYLRSMTACGRIKAKHLKGVDVETLELIAPWKSKGRVKVTLSPADKGIHFHLDVHGPHYYSAEPPEANAKISQVKEVCSRLIGKPIEVKATGRFAVPMDEFGDDTAIGLLSKLIVGSQAQGRLVGSLYEIDDEPVSTIQWQFVEDENEIRVSVDSLEDIEIGIDYLERLASPLAAAFRSVILEKGTDA